jgi:hypothetical protein
LPAASDATDAFMIARRISAHEQCSCFALQLVSNRVPAVIVTSLPRAYL